MESAKNLHQQRPQSVDSSSNMGKTASDRLYYTGIKNMVQRDHEYNRIKSLKSEMEKQGATFKPQINKISQVIAESKSQRSLRPTHERLIEYGINASKKKSLFKDIKDQIEREECIFAPKLNPV